MSAPVATALRLLSALTVAASLVGFYVVPRPPAQGVQPAASVHSALTDVNPIGANFFLEREVEPWKREQTVAMAKEAGIGWIKQMFTWAEIEPRKGYYFDDKFKKSTWEKYDAIVDLADKYGMRIIARLDWTPAWARRDPSNPAGPPDDVNDYVDFVRAVVSRYRGRIQYYQIWNEPNVYPGWEGPDPAGYVSLLRRAYQAAKAIDPTVVILSAPLAQTLENSPRNQNELSYLEGMYRAGAKPYFDVLSANAYGFDQPPDAPADPGVLNFSRLKLLRQVMERNGDGEKPVWFNEFGWNAAPADMPPERLLWRRVSEQQQARYTAEALKLARSWGWVGVLNFWYFRQAGDLPVAGAEYFFRMVDVEFTPRPVYLAVQQVSRTLQVLGPGVHQPAAAGVDARGGWRDQPLASDPSQRMLQSPEQGGPITFTIDGTGLALNVMRGSAAAQLRVLVDPHEAAPSAGGGHVSIPAGPGETQRIPVVSGLSAGKHTIALQPVPAASDPPVENSISDPGPGAQTWAIVSLEVESRVEAWPFGLLGLALLLGASGVGWSYRARRRP